MFNPPQGIIAYAVTPFYPHDNRLDLSALNQVIEHLLSTHPATITFLGSAGESAYLSMEEWCSIALHGVKQVAKRIPVMIGISELTTEAAIRKAQYAEKIGADSLMIIPMSYWKLTEKEIKGYFAAIAEKTNLPIMAYNNPSTSGIDMSPSLLLSLVSEIENIVMVKESSGDIQRMHTLYHESQGELAFYNGSNALSMAALAAGARGWCSAAPNLIDTQPAALYEAMVKGDLEKSRQLFHAMLPLLRFIVAGGLAKTVKAGLALRGINVGSPRHPLTSLTGQSLEELKQLMHIARGN